MLREIEGFIAVDISKEGWRSYVYGDDIEYRIDRPQTLYMEKSNTDSHRVTDDIGRCHCISQGWLAIRWPEKALKF